eukprot:Blabericola_migrator_1__6731@NODE_33_length_18162_cov_161_418900_g29_i0_p19_GENE_NODE_33_length_18162_cov_161_418900_g29_i0NODE_33_length_18162_cov_161_418900_g29_i0_p19_ORF_typecomplete_len102_score19_48SCO1SenC/PF02630_14/0_11_NODE_33_length_18162_cov_161_418900_g29_i01708417389
MVLSVIIPDEARRRSDVTAALTATLLAAATPSADSSTEQSVFVNVDPAADRAALAWESVIIDFAKSGDRKKLAAVLTSMYKQVRAAALHYNIVYLSHRLES